MRDVGFPERSPRRAQLALPPVRACALPSARLVRGAGGAGPISHLSEQAVRRCGTQRADRDVATSLALRVAQPYLCAVADGAVTLAALAK